MMTRIGKTVTVVALILAPVVSADDVVPPGQQQETALPGMTVQQDEVAGSMADQALAVMQAQEAAMQPPTVPPAPAAPPAAPPTKQEAQDLNPTTPQTTAGTAPWRTPLVLTSLEQTAVDSWVREHWPGRVEKYVAKARVNGRIGTLMEWVEAMGGTVTISRQNGRGSPLRIDVHLPDWIPIDVYIEIGVANLPNGRRPSAEDITTRIDVNIRWDQVGEAIADILPLVEKAISEIREMMNK